MERNSAACAMEWSIELEKALRSKKPGRAVEAIHVIGSRLQHWNQEPEPKAAVYNTFDLLIWEDRLFANTILLRLVDAFKFDDKHIRRSVVGIFLELYNCDRKRSKRGGGILSKAMVLNHQELLTRVKSVFDGGDSESKALALILFGCWTHFVNGSAQIRYLILSSLSSPHLLEVKASIFAAACISELAEDFARVFLVNLVDIITSTATLAIKRAGARAFAKFGCSHSIVKMAYKAGLELVSPSHEEDLLVVMLFSLSKLASKSIFICSEQVQFLCSILCQKKSVHVQKTSLRCLGFLLTKGAFRLTNISCMFKVLVNALDEDLPSNLHCDALRLLCKILSYVQLESSLLDSNEFSKLVTIVENASQSLVKLKSLLAIHVLVNLALKLSGKMEIGSGGCSFSFLPSHVISLIMGQIELSGRMLVDLSRSTSEVFQEIKALLNFLLLITREHSDLCILLLEQIRISVESIIDMHEKLWDSQLTDMEEDKKNDISSRLAFIIYRLVAICIDYLGQVVFFSSEIFDKVKLLVESVCQSNLFNCRTCIIYPLLLNCKFVLSCRVTEPNINRSPRIIYREFLIENEIFILELAKRLLQEGNGWFSYKAAKHAACHGSWFAATLIFGNLITKVHSDPFRCWLKSFFQFALAERKIQLLLLAEYGSGLVNWLEKERTLNMFSIEEEISHHQARIITEPIYCDKLLEAYQCLCSSVETLKGTISSNQTFCFQIWFLSLRSKVVGIVGSVLKLLQNISNFCSSEYPELGTNDKAVVHDTLKEFSKVSLSLERLSREFDLIITTFIGMDTKSSNIISVFALSCSLLAFCTGFAFQFPNLSTILTTENQESEDFKAISQAILLRNLSGRLWSVDHEMSVKLKQLFEVTGGPENRSHLSSRSQTVDVRHEARDIMTLCSYAVSEVINLQSKANRLNKQTFLQVIGDGMQFLSNTVMQWIDIPFRTPKCFFSIRPCIGSELFVTAGTHKQDVISVQCGFHLSLDLCLQLREIPSDMSAQITKLYCILSCGLPFQNPGPNGENKEQKQQNYEPWENDEMVEMHNKLLCHVIECSNKEDNTGKCRTSSSCITDELVQAFVQFEPNQKGQGFSNCLLDVSRLPVGCYRIKWYSCCIDSEGSLWGLVPLNSGPLFNIHQLPSMG